MLCSIKSIKANFVTSVKALKGEILEYIRGTIPLNAYMIYIEMFQFEILKCGKVQETHKPSGLSALSFKFLKPYGFKAFSDFSYTLRSRTRKLLMIYIHQLNITTYYTIFFENKCTHIIHTCDVL